MQVFYALKNNNVSLLDDCIGTGDDVQDRKEKSLHELKKLNAAIINHEDYLNSLHNDSDVHR